MRFERARDRPAYDGCMSGDELAELVWNGVAAESGRYAFAPHTIAELADSVRTRAAPVAEHRKRIDEAGWGLAIPDGLDPTIEQAHGLRHTSLAAELDREQRIERVGMAAT